MKSDETKDMEKGEEILPHNHLQDFLSVLIFDISSLQLIAFSANISAIFKAPLQIGTPLNAFFNIHEEVITSMGTHSFRILTTTVQHHETTLLLTANHEYLFIHFEQINDPKAENNFFDLLPITENLIKTNDFTPLLHVCLECIRKIIAYDHLSIRKFDEDNNGQVVATNTLPEVPSYNQMFFPAADIPDVIYSLFHNGLPFIAHDLSAKQTELTCSKAFPKGYIISKDPGIYTAKLWQNMGFKSVALFPIYISGKLWGALVAMHQKPKKMPLEKLASIRYLIYTLATQLQLRNSKTGQIDEKKEQVEGLIEKLNQYTDFATAVKEQQDALCQVMNANGIALFMANQVFHFKSTLPFVITKEIKQKLIDESELPFFQTNNLSVAVPTLQAFKSQVSGVLLIQINPPKKQYLVWHRPSKTKVFQWAGNPKITETTVIPRTVFDPWIEVKTSFSDNWTDRELSFAKEIKNVLTNISKNQYQNLAERKKIFKLIFQHSSDLITVLNEDFSVRYISEAAKTLFGNKVVNGNKKWQRLVHPEDLGKIKNYLVKVVEGTTDNQHIKYRMKNHSGNYILLETIASNYLDNPLFKGILCNTKDITQKTYALNSLSKFQKIIETANSAILIVDTKREAFPIIYSNNGIHHFINRKKEAVIGRSWQLIDAFIEETKGAVLFRMALAKGKAIEATLKIKNSEDHTIWVSAQLSPVVFKKGNHRSDVVIIFSDITSEVNAKEKLKEYSEKLHVSNLELQTFAYVASHDLQEPLRTISGFSELFAETYQDKINQEANEYLTFILQATGRMKKLINDLLYFSRLSTEKGFIKELDVAVILSKAVDNLHSLIEENKAIVTHETLPNILVNETLLLQVFQNLISNAIKYRKEERPKIHVSAQRKKKLWIFGVEDNGIGISEKYYDRIFVIFQRLHTSDEYSGTGIGLAICKKIIEKYGGKIWVESKEGEGSTFYFTIPDVLTLR